MIPAKSKPLPTLKLQIFLFLDNFARSLGMDIQSFSNKALLAKKPVDLGSRCTVFMNSRVKQAQKEGASVGDISAGLSYSVIKNALFKVIKLRDPATLGSKIVVQGGTFNNDAVLRAFEKIVGKDAVRPDVAGLMGAYGAALIAREEWINQGSDYNARSSIAGPQALESFKVDLDLTRCGGCANNCLLTINTFSSTDGQSGERVRKFITGNRCERGAEMVLQKTESGVPDCSVVNTASGTEKREKTEPLPNLFNWKYKRLFRYQALKPSEAYRGDVGILRVLNMYENYPFWFTFFTKLGFRVRLSPRSSRNIYEKGLETIPSESVCYPGKITHGHLQALLDAGIKFIFYPCAPYEIKEDPGAGNHYNCPIVTSYPEVLKNNVEALRDSSVLFMNPFLPIDNKKALTQRLFEEMGDKFSIPFVEISGAVDAAWAEQEKFRLETAAKGEETLKYLKENNLKGVVLAGRPYHLDPEINHGIPELITGLGLAVLTEDSVAPLGHIERPLRIIDQWTYHNRLYRAAQFVSQEEPEIPKNIPQGLAGEYRLRRSMRPRQVSVNPSAHHGLGLGMYAQVTSPLRRYGDLVSHQQLSLFLENRKTMDKETLFDKIAQGDIAASECIKAERESCFHWKLVYLLQNPQWQGEAVIVETGIPKAKILIPELAMESQINIPGNLQLNDRIKVKAENIELWNLKVDFVPV